jgi:2-polyprenyl-3-methyl-5-hydroxy-6-metoxy-1,4-benzoquinol methylase/tetratricopeptide (TPR) repeat protein
VTSSAYQQALDLAEAGQHQQALDEIATHLAANPDDGEALNDAGTLLYALGRFDEAVEYLQKACKHLGDQRGQALWNLAEIFLSAGRAASAVDLFSELAELELLNVDMVNRAAAALIDEGDLPLATEAIISSLAVCPEQEVLLPILDVIRSKRPRVAFFCANGDSKFMTNIYGHVAARFESRYFGGDLSPDELVDALEWCDIAWLEWCTDLAVTVSKLPKVCRTICRLHRYEAYRKWPAEVQWENIDALVLVGNEFVAQRLRQTVGDIETRTRVLQIANGVDLETFSLVEKPRGKQIAVVGNMNYWKGPVLHLLAFHEIHKVDHDYHLHFAGPMQDDGVVEDYMDNLIKELGLEGSVTFHGPQDDIAGWLEDKHYVVSASMVEGHPVNVLEGMARGLRPLVHTWPGARDFFPEEYIFRTPQEYATQILQGDWNPLEYHQFVAERFSLARQAASVNTLMCEIEKTVFDKSLLRRENTSPAADQGANFYNDMWQKQAPQPEKPFARKRRERIVETICTEPTGELAILDFGCGRGTLGPHLAQLGSVTGVDWSEEGIAEARRLCPEGNFIRGDFFEVELPETFFDVVVSQEVIEHLQDEDQRRYLARAMAVLKPGGRLVMTTPNAPVVDVLNQIALSTTNEKWSDQPIENVLDKAALRELLDQAGFEIVTLDAFLERPGAKGAHLFALARKPGATA